MMNNVVREEETGNQHLLSLRPIDHASSSHMRASHVTLGQDEQVEDGNTVVTLEETDGNPLLLCPMDESRVICQPSPHLRQHHLATDATLTYATLDSRGNIVLQQFKSESHGQSSQQDMEVDGTKGEVCHGSDGVDETHRSAAAAGGPRLVVVGEGGLGDAMTYIYIQGEAESVEDGSEMEPSNAHTITLNSADGSTLQTLPAAYTQHLEHTYGDLVVVGGGSGSNSDSSGLGDGRAVSATLQEVTAANSGHQQDEQVLLLSVAPLKLEDESEQPSLSLPTSQENIQCQESQPTSIIMDDVVPSGRGRREGGHRDDTFPDDETSIEARLATRDSLLPPRRNRRCGDPSKLTCPICHSQFKSARHYHSHLQIHRGHGLWHCDICEYTCDSAVELRLHKTQLHQDARPFKCPNCHLSFPKSLMLEDHIRNVHNKERPYTCSFCTKGFYRPHDLKMHLNLHLGIKSNVCHICGRQFSHPSNLIRHQRLHTGIKPYVCATCGKRFTQVTLLQKHRTTHQPGAGVCPLCPSTFRSAAGLRKHSKLEHKKPMTLQEAARIIRGQRGAAGRSYYCRICGAQFSLKSELKEHEDEEHSKNTEHPCASCNKVYSILEVKTHTCLTAEEEEQRNRLNSPQRSISPEATITAIASSAMMRSPGNNSKDHEAVEEEEEEYLVMYITPEGESVSYVMKKGSKISRDEVLHLDAPRTDQLHEDGFSRPTLPEETIMINVQDRPFVSHHSDDQTIVHSPQVQDDILAPRDTDLADLDDDNPDSPMAVQSIKLEPQASDEVCNDPIDISQISDKSLLPLDTLNMPTSSKTQKKSTLQPISIKGNEDDFEIKKELFESGTEAKPDVSTVVPLTCKDCGKTFQKQWNFQQHIATHDASLHRYKCGMCTLTFAYRSTLNRHLEKHRSNQELHECKQCNKTYKCLTSLKQHHKRDHMRQRPFVCDLCGKDFFSKSDFKYHMRLHKKEQPYMCFACGREFSHVSHLHRHERVHTGERPHKCPFCPKKFIQFVTLKIHLKKHEKKGTEEMDIISSDRFSDCEVGVNLAVGGEIVNNDGTVVSNMSHSMCNGDGEGLNTSRNPEEPLAVHGDCDTRLDRSVVGHSAPTMMSSATDSPELSGSQLPPGTIILAQGDLNGTHTSGQFSGGHTAVVTGMDGDCIAIFVQESLE